jgi:lipoate-protein ligase B
MTPNVLTASALGATSYRRGLALQQALVDARAAGETGDWLLFPDHPPVLTVGRSPSDGNLRVDRATLERKGIELFEVSRGGDITWHGPGQLVGYAIVDLNARGRDLHRHLRALEQSLIDALGEWGIAGERSEGRTGVWVEGEKIASIGVAVRRWVTYHGFALNVEPDLSNFELIHPCGLHGIRMTSIAKRLGNAAPAFGTVRERVAAHVSAALGFERLDWADPAEVSRIEERAGAVRPAIHSIPQPLTRAATQETGT